MIILQLVGVRHRGKETFITMTIVKIQCDQWPSVFCGKVFAVAFNAFSFGCFQKPYDVTFFLSANVSYAIWKSSQDRVSFNIFPSTHFWLTQNTEISKYLVCQEVSFPGLIDCQFFRIIETRILSETAWDDQSFWIFPFSILSYFKTIISKILHTAADWETYFPPRSSVRYFCFHPGVPAEGDVSDSAAHSHLEMITNCLTLFSSHTGKHRLFSTGHSGSSGHVLPT